MKKLFFYISAILFASVASLTICAMVVYAGQVTLTWDTNDPTPSGYALFVRDHSTGGYGPTPVWTGAETTATVDLPDSLETAVIVRAYNIITKLDGTQYQEWSGDSNEVVYIPTTQPDTPANLRQVIEQALRDISDALASVADAMNK